MFGFSYICHSEILQKK